MAKKMTAELSYTCEFLRNEYGSDYGTEYVIQVKPGENPFELQEMLIAEVIGEDRFYGPRDVWDQIRIKYNYL